MVAVRVAARFVALLPAFASFVAVADGRFVCPSDDQWSLFRRKCYRSSANKYDFDTCKAGCRTHFSAALAVVSSEQQFQFVVSTLGWTDTFVSIKKENGVWNWTDGTPVTYVKWSPTSGTGNCAALIGLSGLTARPCSQKAYAGCQRDAEWTGPRYNLSLHTDPSYSQKLSYAGNSSLQLNFLLENTSMSPAGSSLTSDDINASYKFYTVAQTSGTKSLPTDPGWSYCKSSDDLKSLTTLLPNQLECTVHFDRVAGRSCVDFVSICFALDWSVGGNYEDLDISQNQRCMNTSGLIDCSIDLQTSSLQFDPTGLQFGYGRSSDFSFSFSASQDVAAASNDSESGNFVLNCFLASSASQAYPGEEIVNSFRHNLDPKSAVRRDTTVSVSGNVTSPSGSECYAFVCFQFAQPEPIGNYIESSSPGKQICKKLIECQDVPVTGLAVALSSREVLQGETLTANLSWHSGSNLVFALSWNVGSAPVTWSWLASPSTHYGAHSVTKTKVYGTESGVQQIWISSSNSISAENISAQVGISVPITGLQISASLRAAIPQQIITIFFRIATGTSVNFTLTLGNGEETSLSGTAPFEQSINVSFATRGNYSVTVEAKNSVSAASVNLSQPIVIQNRIVSLDVQADPNVDCSNDVLGITMTLPNGHDPLSAVHCNWSLSQSSTSSAGYMYVGRLSDGQPFHQNVPFAGSGSQELRMNCSNAVSGIGRRLPVNLTQPSFIVKGSADVGTVSRYKLVLPCRRQYVQVRISGSANWLTHERSWLVHSDDDQYYGDFQFCRITGQHTLLCECAAGCRNLFVDVARGRQLPTINFF